MHAVRQRRTTLGTIIKAPRVVRQRRTARFGMRMPFANARTTLGTFLHSLRNRNAQQLHACFNHMRR
jgi:hypothetical protein